MNLERCCIAMRRQRKPIRQHIHRAILLKHLKKIRPMVEQIRVKLQQNPAADSADGVPT
jgi:hypothetical protein